jgi:hypothetical protein
MQFAGFLFRGPVGPELSILAAKSLSDMENIYLGNKYTIWPAIMEDKYQGDKFPLFVGFCLILLWGINYGAV